MCTRNRVGLAALVLLAVFFLIQAVPAHGGVEAQRIQNRSEGIAKSPLLAWIWRPRPSKIGSTETSDEVTLTIVGRVVNTQESAVDEAEVRVLVGDTEAEMVHTDADGFYIVELALSHALIEAETLAVEVTKPGFRTTRLGIVRNEAVSVTIGATVFTDVAALLVLAIVAGTQDGDASVLSVVGLIALMIGYAMLILLGLPRAGKLFFRRFTTRAIEFQFVLVALFVAALLAERIGMHAIVGAFLAGLAINSTLPARSAVIGQVLFLGESFFIPIFLMYIGMITDPLAVLVNIQTLLIGAGMTIAVYMTKFAAAWVTTRVFHYSRDELFTIWGLSQAQAAATLATILVGVEINLFPMTIFNGAILMILCTCITSPLLVQRFGLRLHPSEAPREKRPLFDRILVPIANPKTQEHLITLADILSRISQGTLLPLHVAQEVNRQVVGLEHQ